MCGRPTTTQEKAEREEEKARVERERVESGVVTR
jgi:hypothetical protein